MENKTIGVWSWLDSIFHPLRLQKRFIESIREEHAAEMLREREREAAKLKRMGLPDKKTLEELLEHIREKIKKSTKKRGNFKR